ncbi:hypothetical protein V5O48_006708 [Marasmius crinis-equi]|uniref:Uncharacterized protein n=1 Tax=Marasmius crinis-equi TaxID=585013 RepID=A0ABR3FIU7_9AGAR
MPPDRRPKRNHPSALTVSGWASPPSTHAPPPPETTAQRQEREKQEKKEKFMRDVGWKEGQYARQDELACSTGAFEYRREIAKHLNENKSHEFVCPRWHWCAWYTNVKYYDVKLDNGEIAPTFHQKRKQHAYNLYMKHLQHFHLKPEGVKWGNVKGYRILVECEVQPYVPHPDRNVPAVSLETDT